MRDEWTRRDVVKLASVFGAMLVLAGARAQPVADAQNGDAVGHSSNFRAVYGDPVLRAAFFQFLKNVYNLYPEQRFHQLIEQASSTSDSDRDIYRLAQARLKDIKPLLGDVRYALPALARQKVEMAHEILGLLGPSRKIDGYMEIGTTGRYISQFRPDLQIRGDMVLLHTDEPGYSPTDVVERGQLRKIGRFVPLQNYAPVATQAVGDASLDLVSNFIGFHHSPLERLDGFVASLQRVLRPGGRLIVRDHDVDSDRMNRMVALAHDVFNMGLGTDWDVNQRELRHFTSVAQLTAYLEQRGFKGTRKQVFQPGDPTRNALMEFVRT